MVIKFWDSPFKRAPEKRKEKQQQRESAPPQPTRDDGPVARALPLLTVRSGKFVVGEDALKALSEVEGDVAIVAVCGRARQGKSFLLNAMLDKLFAEEDEAAAAGDDDSVHHPPRLGRFRVSDSTKSCTEGLHLYSKPLVGEKDGRKTNLFFVDSEGIDASDRCSDDGAKLFSVALLISSVFVYNAIGAIDEAALDKLSLTCELGRLLQSQASGSPNPPSTAEGGDPTCRTNLPHLIWLLRDFFLTFEDGGCATDYLERALETEGGAAAAPVISARNSIRASIQALFRSREAVALVRPHADERTLRRLDAIPSAALRPEFTKGVDELIAKMFYEVTPKRVGQKAMDGRMVADLIEQCARAVNGGALPSLAAAWEGVAEAQCARAVEAAMDAFHAQLRAGECTPACTSPPSLEATASAEAIKVFNAIAAGEGSGAARESQAKLRRLMREAFDTWQHTRDLENELRCVEAIREAERERQALLAQAEAAAEREGEEEREGEGEAMGSEGGSAGMIGGGGEVGGGGETDDAIRRLVGFIEGFAEDFASAEMGPPSQWAHHLTTFLVASVGELGGAITRLRAKERAAGVQAGRKEGREEGREEGRAERAAEVAATETAMGARLATLKEVLASESQALGIKLHNERLKNAALQKQVERLTMNVQSTSAVVETWAKEAAAAARSTPVSRPKAGRQGGGRQGQAKGRAVMLAPEREGGEGRSGHARQWPAPSEEELCGAFLAKTELKDVTNRSDGPTFLL